MVSIKQVINSIEKFAPLELAESFDNCGLKIGNLDEEVTGVLITVDTNVDVVNEAYEKGCNLIIEHHPSIWTPLKSIDVNLPLNKALIEAAQKNIAIYSAHTNVDYTVGGLNDHVAEKIGLKDVKCVSGYSSARIGSIDDVVTIKEYARKLSTLFNDDNISIVGDLNKKISKVAVINGGGGGHSDFIIDAFNSGADVFVTAEVKHSVARLAKDLNYVIIQVGHFSSEKDFLPLIKQVLNKVFSTLNVSMAEKIDSPYNRRDAIWN